MSFTPPASATDQTPLYVAELQDIQVDYTAGEKDLMGPNAFPLARAFVERKIACKAKYAKMTGGLIAAALDGSVSTTGSKIAVSEVGVVATGAVTVAGSATFVDTIGVRDSSGVIYSKVPSAPTGPQFSVAAGVYTFNVTENGKSLRFVYTKTIAGGKTIVLANLGMGLATSYKVELFNDSTKNGGLNMGMEIAAVTIPKLSFPFKNTDFTIFDLDFSALDDGNGNVVTLYTA